MKSVARRCKHHARYLGLLRTRLRTSWQVDRTKSAGTSKAGARQELQTTLILAVLKEVGHKIGFMTGTRTRVPKPTRMSEACPELQTLMRVMQKPAD